MKFNLIQIWLIMMLTMGYHFFLMILLLFYVALDYND